MERFRIRRSALTVPANDRRKVTKALRELTVDEIILDLEDSVPPSEKERTRQEITGLFTQLGRPHGKVVAIRINGLDTKWWLDDLNEVTSRLGGSFDCVVIPKVEEREDVVVVDRVLTFLEAKLGIKEPLGLEVQIESAMGVEACEKIAGASKRVEALVFGPLDYCADLGMMPMGSRDDKGGPLEIVYPMMRISNAAKAHGLQAIDGPYVKIDDLEGLEASAAFAKRLGYDGKWVIHPSQIDVCNRIFTPSQEEVERAKKVLEEYERATKTGAGATRLDNEMIDAASVRLARRTLRIAGALGLL